MDEATLFGDLKTDEEKYEFFLSGLGHGTGVIALSIQNDVAMAYKRCANRAKENADLRAKCARYEEALVRIGNGERFPRMIARKAMEARDE